MLILKNSCFIHVPKTGGNWVRHALEAAQVEFEYYTVNGNAHLGFRECPQPGRFKFAFVRHPLGLYRSFWQYKMTYGWDEASALDRACRSQEFGTFIVNITTHFPGAYGHALDDLIGPAEAPIDFVGRYENLQEDLIRALTRAGESFNEARLREVPAVNVSDKARFPAEYTPELIQRIEVSEQGVFRRFGYRAE